MTKTALKFTTHPIGFLRVKLAPLLPFVPRLTQRGLVFAVWLLAVLAVLDLARLLADFYDYQVIWQALTVILWGVSVVLVGVFLIEFVMLLGAVRVWHHAYKADEIAIQRTTPSNLFLHVPSPIRIGVHTEVLLPSWLGLSFVDSIPKKTDTDSFPMSLPVPVVLDQGVNLTYELTPTARGIGEFGAVYAIFLGRWRLFEMYYANPIIDGQDTIRVLANVEQNLSGNLVAAAHKSAIDGILQKRRRGLGQSFHQVRAYNEGDSIRHIDWRATSRLARLMTKEYEDDQNQELLFLIDSSFRMRHNSHNDEHSLSHLDTVLGAMLALSNLALQQGDKVGFVSFSGMNDKIVPTKKGHSVLTHLLNQSANITPSFDMPDYLAVAKTALNLQKKRTLIVLLTTTRSEDISELKEAMSLLSAKHLVVVAGLYEESLHKIINDTPYDGDMARSYHSVYEHLGIGRAIKTELDNMANIHAFYTTPSHFPRKLIDVYMSLKRHQAVA